MASQKKPGEGAPAAGSNNLVRQRRPCSLCCSDSQQNHGNKVVCSRFFRTGSVFCSLCLHVRVCYSFIFFTYVFLNFHVLFSCIYARVFFHVCTWSYLFCLHVRVSYILCIHVYFSSVCMCLILYVYPLVSSHLYATVLFPYI